MNPPKKTIRFRGITFSPELEGALKEEMEQSVRDPEDQDQAEVRNSLKKYGTPSVD